MKKSILFLSVLMFFQSCTMVTLKTPIGETPESRQLLSWEGIWYDGDNTVLFINIRDRKGAVLSVKAVEGSGESLKVKEFEVALKRGDKMIFANIPFKDVAEKKELNEKNRDLYIWGVVKYFNRMILFYLPDGDELKALVEDGKLTGSVEKGYVHLSTPAGDIMKMSELKSSDKIIDWKNPLIFRKLK